LDRAPIDAIEQPGQLRWPLHPGEFAQLARASPRGEYQVDRGEPMNPDASASRGDLHERGKRHRTEDVGK
jgi:hypothetical protein